MTVIERDVYIPMRDGVRISADIYRPEGDGPFPVVLNRTPYLKAGAMMGDGLTSRGTPSEIPARVLGAPVEGLGPMLASLSPLITAGYAVVVSDVRGTGHSEGVYDYYNIEGGPNDGYDSVEWLAAQPWCDGNVGMTGASASAIYCYQAAVTQPPHLRAMFVNMHPADYYSDQWFVGGVFRWENRIGWCTMMQSRMSPQHPGPRDDPNYETKRRVYEDRYRQYYDRMLTGNNAFNADWLTELFEHKTNDQFWKDRSYLHRFDEVQVPVFHGGVWYDHFIRGTLTSHEAVSTPKKLLVGPGWHGAPDSVGDGEIGALQVRWFDHFLRGEENGILDEPPVRLYVYGEEKWIDEPAWPVPATETAFYFAAGPGGGAESLNDGLLATSPRQETTASISHNPAFPNETPFGVADQRSFERGALTFSTPPLEQDTEVIGSVKVIIHASTDAPDVDWCVRLCDVFEDGRSRLLNTGALKGSHHASHESPEPLQPGRTYEFEVEVWAVANVFKKGHRIRIDISNSDFPFFESNPVASNSQVCIGGENGSRLVVPVVVR